MNKTTIAIGNFLYKKAFTLYNIIYPIYKTIQDRHEIKLLKNIVKPGDNVIDIGSNIGFYTKLFSKLVTSTGHVYGFEPESNNFRHLANNCQNLTNVTLLQKAVADKLGKTKIYKSKLLNIDHRTYPFNNYESIEEIENVTIDSMFNESIKIDFIKMDIQGYEFYALTGMKNLISRSAKISILMEFWPYAIIESGKTVRELISIIENYGLQIYRIERGVKSEFILNSEEFYTNSPFEYYENILLEKSTNDQ